MVRLKDPVRLPTGEISTCANLLNAGRAKVAKVENWCGRGRPAYFCDLVDGSGGWQIGEVAYLSRSKMPVF